MDSIVTGFYNTIEPSEEKFLSKKVHQIYGIPDEEAIPKTISENWFSLKNLENEFRFKPSYVKNIKELKKEYCGWRKVRGDGNCYYRAVVSSYMLKIFHPSKNDIDIYEFLKRLQNIGEDYPQDFIEAKIKISEFITELYRNRMASYENKVECFDELNKMLQVLSFDLHLIKFTRLLSHYALSVEYKDQITPFMIEEEVESTKRRTLTMGTEAEGVELIACPLSLGIVVKQVNIFETVLLYNIFPDKTNEENDENKPKIEETKVNIICKSRGHYDILYSIKDMEVECFCLMDGSYYINK